MFHFLLWRKQWIKIHTAWLTMEGTAILLWDFEMKILAYLLCDCNPTTLIFPGKQGHLSQLNPCLSSVSWIEVTLHPSCSKLSMCWLLPIRNTWMAFLLSISVEWTCIIPDCFHLDNWYAADAFSSLIISLMIPDFQFFTENFQVPTRCLMIYVVHQLKYSCTTCIWPDQFSKLGASHSAAEIASCILHSLFPLLI